MSWVHEQLRQRRDKQSQAQAEPRRVNIPQPPAWLDVWNNIYNALEQFIFEFNGDEGPQFAISRSGDNSIIQIIPRRNVIEVTTAVLEVTDKTTGRLKLTCTISKPGVPRHGEFQISQGFIAQRGEIVGTPKPTELAMTPEQFAKYVLDPVLFPDLQ